MYPIQVTVSRSQEFWSKILYVFPHAYYTHQPPKCYDVTLIENNYPLSLFLKNVKSKKKSIPVTGLRGL
jgi:hypothetical protein